MGGMAAKKKKTPSAGTKKVARKTPARKKTAVVRNAAETAPVAAPLPPAATSEELQVLARDLQTQLGELTTRMERIDARVDAFATSPDPETARGAGLSRESLAPLAEPMAAFVRAYKEAHEIGPQSDRVEVWAYVLIAIWLLLVTVIVALGGRLSSDAVAMLATAGTVVGLWQVLRYFQRRRRD